MNYEGEKKGEGVEGLREKLKAMIAAGEIKDGHIKGNLNVDRIEEDELMLWDEIESLENMDEKKYEELADKVDKMMLEKIEKQTQEEIMSSPSNNLLSFLASLLMKKARDFGAYGKKEAA